MLYEYLRIFKESSGSFTDLSLDNQEEAKNLVPALTSTDYLYVSQYFPLNNLYFNIGSTANATSANIKIEYWDGVRWRDAVDILDATNVSGAPLARSGVIQFNADSHFAWFNVADTSDNNAPSELQALTLYNSFWLRISFDTDLDAGLEIKEITYAFTDSQELDNWDIEINDFLESFASGKTDWIDEIITASKMVMIDLRRQGLVVDKGQVVRFDDVFIPATYKTLDLIYMNLGPSYLDKRREIRDLYTQALNIKRFTVDANADGKIDRREISGTIKRLIR